MIATYYAEIVKMWPPSPGLTALTNRLSTLAEAGYHIVTVLETPGKADGHAIIVYAEFRDEDEEL